MHYQEKTFFGLRHRDTFELIRVNDGAGRFNSYYSLTKDKSCPVLELDSLDQVHELLMENTPDYNAVKASRANWSEFRRAELIPVQVRVIEEMQDLALPEALQVQTVEQRDIARRVGERYAGQPLPIEGDALTFWLVNLPEGVSLVAARERIGSKVYSDGDVYTGRRLLAVVPPPQEYEPLTLPGRGALLLTALYGV